MGQYYDGTKLLSLKDLHGNTPEIFIACSNRSDGKTTYFNKLLVKRFLSKGQKFMIINRYRDEIGNADDKFFSEIHRLFFKDMEMVSVKCMNGLFEELFLDDVSCGYAVPLNSADKIKKISHLFADTAVMIFDEYQSENGVYAPNEIQKFISLHTSVARGGGKQVRYVPVYMCSNLISVVNPYFLALGITDRLDDKTKFLRGNGFVMEQHFNEYAAQEQAESGFNKAFGSEAYVQYTTQLKYLNDSSAFINKPTGQSNYICTIIIDKEQYAVRYYYQDGVAYCDQRVNEQHPSKISVKVSDHNVGYRMAQSNSFIIQALRSYFDQGNFYFKNARCKSSILHALRYNL